MKRGKRLERKSQMKRSGRIKAKRRSKAERDRHMAEHYGGRERMLRIKAMPCAVPGCGARPCENHHLDRKTRRWDSVVNLCGFHHRLYHDRFASVESFDAEFGTDLEALAARLAEAV